tara:strand:+ start:2329 stop:2625 length:297 start_codon:yes stop_codon:yes gene_type:complete
MELNFQKLNDTKPVSDDEYKVLLLLVMRGYKKNKIQFRHGLDGNRHLRYKYWEKIKQEDLEYIEEHSNIKLEGIKIFDDDCGDKFWYDISLSHTKENT